MMDDTIIRVLLTVFVSAMRLLEIAASRRWYVLARQNSDSAPAVRIISEPVYPFMVALHTLWLAGGIAEPLLLGRVLFSMLFWPMAACWITALALRVWMLWAMGRLWHVRILDRPVQPVVTTGPYRFIRHPNYLAVIIELGAFPLMTGAYLTAVTASFANAAVLWFRIRREEEYLFSLSAYRRAFTDKKRFIPGLF